MAKEHLLHGDCIELLPTLPSASVDCVVTDPPYGANVAKWDRDIPPQCVLDECLRISRGAVVWFGGAVAPLIGKTFQYVPPPERVLIWYVTFTMSKAANNGMYYRWQPIYTWRLPDKTTLEQDVIKQHTEAKIQGFNHPGMKPVKLMRKIIAGLGCQSVLDPFMGSGTTGVACKELGVEFTGIEIEKEYFRIAKKRIANVPPSFAMTHLTQRRADGGDSATQTDFYSPE